MVDGASDGADVCSTNGAKVSSNCVIGANVGLEVGIADGLVVLGEQTVSRFTLILTLLLRAPPPPTTLVWRMPKSSLR